MKKENPKVGEVGGPVRCECGCVETFSPCGRCGAVLPQPWLGTDQDRARRRHDASGGATFDPKEVFSQVASELLAGAPNPED